MIKTVKKIYFGGDIITMRQEEDAPEAVVVEDETIAYVGSLAHAKKLCETDEAEEIDLMGRTLMPSFIDSHSIF